MALVQTGTASTSCTREIQDSKIQDCCGVFSWNLGYRGPDRYRAPVFKIPKKGPAAILCLGILHLPGTTCTGLYRGQGRYPGSLGRGSLSHKMVYQLPTASTIYCFRVVGFTQPQIGRSMGGYHSLLRYIVYLCLSLAPSLFCFLSLSLSLSRALVLRFICWSVSRPASDLSLRTTEAHEAEHQGRNPPQDIRNSRGAFVPCCMQSESF